MSKIHELAFDAEEIDELLDSVDKKTIYQDATQSEHGLMSTTDKTKLDALPTAQQIEGSLSEKVDKEEGKGLSENDYTDAEKESVASAYHKPQNGIPKTDLDSSVQTSLDNADTALQSFTETDPTVPSWAKQPNKPSYDYSEIGNTPDLSGFITKSVNDLTNYYLKSETYTKAEVAALIGAIQQFHYEIYSTLPQSGESNVLYLIGPTGSGGDKYEEYVYSNNAFTKIGDTSIDLSGYVTTSALNTALSAYTTTSDLTTLLSNKADKVSNATNGNLAGLDSNGNLTDSGISSTDISLHSSTPKIYSYQYIDQLTSEQVAALKLGDIVIVRGQSQYGDYYSYYVTFKNEYECNIDTPFNGENRQVTYSLNNDSWEYAGTENLSLSDYLSKIQSPVAGNFVSVSSSGSVYDSGKKASDFATSEQGELANTAYQKPQTGIPESDLDSSVQTSLNKADMVVEVDEVTAAVLCYLNARINGIVEVLNNGLPSLKVEELTIARKLVAYITEGNALASGEGAPTILPQYNGQEYFDATNKVWYKAAYTGTSPTAAAWKQITNA